MAATKYTYSIAGDIVSGVLASDLLASEIDASPIVVALKHIDTCGDALDVWFVDNLSPTDQALLGDVVAAHDGTGYATPDEGRRGESFVFVADASRPYLRIKSTRWKVIARVRYRGAEETGDLLAIKAVMSAASGAEVWLRVYDATHDEFVCEGSYTSSDDAAIVDLGTIQNVPAKEAVLEIHGKHSGGEGRLHFLGIDYE